MLCFYHQNINRTVFLTSRPLNMLRSASIVFWLLLNTSSFFFFRISLWLHQRRHQLCCILISKDLIRTLLLALWPLLIFFHCLFWGFPKLNTYTVPCLFVDRVQKCNSCLSVRTLTCNNSSGTLFFVCFSVNMFFLPFSTILTWKSINHS